ncbi:MAG: DUF438 domain-containing protein, partial [Chloroflexi bacterium]|nr:DUF438 domain-containing protein [Chloroflexota bacterium]
VALDTLLKDIAAEIENRTGEGAEVGVGKKGVVSASDEKTVKLKQIIIDLHQGVPFEDVKKRFDELITDVEPTEIVAMEEQIIREGMPVEEVRKLSDLHVAVFKQALDAKDVPVTPEGHPVHTFMEENKIFTNTVGDMDLLFEQLQIDSTPAKLNELKQPLQEALDKLSRVEIHYQRKENQLFPFLEKHEITGPPQVMWSVHDDIRVKLKKTREAFESQDISAFLDNGQECTQAIVDMVFKENHILFPLSLDLLDQSEWVDIRNGESDIGYAFAAPAVDWLKATAVAEPAADADKAGKDAGRLSLDTGLITLNQVNLILKHLPVDLTFVDENDEARYFSAGKERIFPRSPGIIGRKVHQCHPAKSLDTVSRIVDDFKNGTKDKAEFWIQMSGRLIYIRYFAVRDDEDIYRGTLEVSQDITDIQSITGERRLLNWDD